MQRKRGKLPHRLTKYFYIIPNEWANKSNQKCICRACMDMVEKAVFAVKYSPEQIQNIIDLVLAISTSKKRIAISHIDEDEEKNSISTTSTHSSGSFLKKQSTLSQYIGQSLNASEVPKFECLVLCAIISSGTLVTKDDTAFDNDLILSSEIKVTINRDSFWESLVMLCNLLHPFCEALDLMQSDDNDNGDEDSSLEANWDLLIEEEFEEEQDDFDEVDIDFLSSEIHSAENQAVKWELQNLFLPNLLFPFENI
ncbi:40738_t:CDS:2 [Gigaspora margarita]|uniref:40738_t:CDS:1 n=1 Tax=Gigaspora margarita TaxID=4874 RepID=A0ABN7UQE0_GIGMA|nr:40738_t:CDS:2 [Gigaspora margarita]